MGFFDFLKKKPKEETKVQPSNSGTFIQKSKVTKTEKEEYHELGNGIGYTTSIQTAYTEYAYNEVLAYARFFDRYSTVKAPKYMHECDYVHWQFMSAGVKDVHKLHLELFEKDYYEPAKTEDILAIYKVPEIKQVAASLGIMVSGKKENVIKMIAEKASAADVSKLLNVEIFSVSEKAKKYLETHALDIEYYSRDENDMSLEEYKAKRSTVSKDDIEWSDLQKDLKADKDGFGRNPYLNIAYFYERHQKFADALLSYLKVLYIDLSGVDSCRAWKLCSGSDIKSVDFRVDCSGTIIIAPGIINYIRKLINQYYSPDMLEKVYSLNLPIQACSKKMFEEIIALIQKDALTQEVTKKIEDALNKNVKAMARSFSK